jgi:hypothetical protein
MAILAILSGVVSARAFGGDVLAVHGSATSQPSQWTVDQLKRMPTTQISFVGHDGASHQCTCVALLDVLHAAGVSTELKKEPKADPSKKHPALRVVLLLSAGDGYAVAFALGELLPDAGQRAAWLAVDRDGKPLEGSNTPVNLVVPGDKQPGRWVHGVDDIEVDSIPLASH